MATLTPQQREALIRAEQQARIAVKARLVDYARGMWNSLGSWRDADIDRFVSALVPRVMAGQLTVARLTDAYLAQMTGQSPVGAIDVSQGLRADSPSSVYMRPAVEMRTALANGAPLASAVQAGAVRVVSLVVTDLQLANTHQARKFTSGREVNVFRRTLTGQENCGLCVVASTQRYHRGNLMPIHPGCDCGIEPFMTDTPEEQVIDPGLLEEIHAAVEAHTGNSDRGARAIGLGAPRGDYLTLTVTRQHGDIGPLLVWRDQRFTGPSDLAS